MITITPQVTPSIETKDSLIGITLFRVRRVLATHGVIGSLNLVLKKLSRKTSLEVSERDKTDAAFDAKWGVDTVGELIPKPSGCVGGNQAHGVRYQGADPSDIIAQLNILRGRLKEDIKNYTFVDYGSGKGRSLVIASQYNFKRVIGVEYSADLNAIAEKNIAGRWPVEIVHADAAEYPIPSGPLVLFMFNPFGEVVMEKLSRRLSQSIEAEKRHIIVIYLRAKHASVWLANPNFSEIEKSPSGYLAVFESIT